MKNLGTLYGYEVKKLLKRPLTWIVALLMMAVAVYAALGLRTQIGYRLYSGPDGDAMEFISEDAWNVRMLEGARALNGQRMDEAFFQAMRENVPDLSGDELQLWFYHEDPTYSHAYHMVTGMGEDLGITAAQFYEARWELMETRWENYGLSEEEKDYWRAMEAQIEEPYIYEYPWNGAGLNGFFTTMYTLIVPLALAAAVCLCPIFSEEAVRKVDMLIFASRECRLPLYLAKILAGITGALLMAALVLDAHTAAYLIAFGVEGLNAPLQMVDIVYSLPVNIGQALLYMLLLLAMYTLACGALAALLSALTHKTAAALIIPVIFTFGLTQSRLTAPYLPHNLITWDGVQNVSLFRVPGGYLNIFQVGMLLYPLTALLLFALCWLCWRRWAVAGR